MALMTPEEQAVAGGLSQEAIDRIDAALLSHAKRSWRKVAMIVGLAMRVPGLPDLFYAERVKALVAKGALIAEGNLEYMRYSEVRLP
jgi:hypothetical protein